MANLTDYDTVGRMHISRSNHGNILAQTRPNEYNALTPESFFDTQGIKGALQLLDPQLPNSPQERVAVYFNDIQGFGVWAPEFSPLETPNWWEIMTKDFLPGIKDMPTSVDSTYYYEGHKENRVTKELQPDTEEFVQILTNLFGGALKAFSSFVGKPHINFDSNSYMGEMKFEKRFGYCSNRLPWYGTLGKFLESAEAIEQTLEGMKKQGYKVGQNLGGERTMSDMRLVHPSTGMVIMRSYKQHLDTLVPDGETDGRLKWGSTELPRTLILPRSTFPDLEKRAAPRAAVA
jgi:hypothetical protein